MEIILKHYILFIAVYFILMNKMGLRRILAESKFKIIYKMSNCDFCMSFWISALSVCILNTVMWSFSRVDFLMPFFLMGIHLTVQKLKDNE